MAEASAINQVAALGESVTGLTEVFQQAMGQMTEFVNQAGISNERSVTMKPKSPF